MHRVDANPGNDRDHRYQCPVWHGEDAGEDADHRDVEDHQHDVGDEQRGDQAPDDVRLLLEQQWARGDVVQRQSADHHRGRARTWNAEGQHWHQCATSRSTDGSFWRGETTGITLTEFATGTGDAFFGHVGHGAGQRRAGTRQHAHDETEQAATDVHHEHRRRFLEVEHHPPGGFHRFLTAMGFLQQQQNLTDREQTEHQHNELNAVSQVDVVTGEAVNAAVGVDADARQEQADQRRDEGLQRSITGHTAETDNRKHHQHEVFRRAEGYRPFRQQRRKQHHAAGGDKRADKRTPRRQRQRDTSEAFAGHRVAVEGGHHGRCFARNVQQDRADPSAVFTAQVHRCQQNQRRLRRQAESKSNRNQQGHAIDRAKARQQADDGADQRAGQGRDQVVRAQRNAEALTQITEGIHISSPARRAGQGAAERPSHGRTAGTDRWPSAWSPRCSASSDRHTGAPLEYR
ncbi:hypothetical protein D3C87_1226520 [compost metagenome]